ncbi:MAG: BACON domain-containing protein, partial [Bacteroidales bacterium]|nr:BACON domain-containing protein [Bacteroidales bacterium]
MKRFLSLLSCLAVLLVQACHPEPFLNVSPTSLSFNQDGGSQTVRVSANYAWTVSISGTGLTVSPLSGEGEGTVTVTAAPAGTASETTGSITFQSEGLSASVAVKQDAKS